MSSCSTVTLFLYNIICTEDIPTTKVSTELIISRKETMSYQPQPVAPYEL